MIKMEIETLELEPILSSPSEVTSKKRVRKLQHQWTNQETMKLIEAVEIREGTWNYLVKEYRDRNLREALWQEVADVLELPRAEVTTKWNSLRCGFRASFNRIGASKSGQGATKTVSSNPFYNALKFLEPTLRVEASTTSNLIDINEPSQEQSLYDPEFLEEEIVQPKSAKASTKRQRQEDSEYAKVVESALQTMNSAAKSDPWDDMGNFVASNGREFAAENIQLSKRFKIAINEVVLNYQKEFASPQ
ncbi:PREDICTED: uncharacterized protein LOC108363745 isoform X1 [Rhagoletis zephyria]|uniref:uncharacterized protein LOC108363745 isoform X1 n=2 Tax=Rhagoletis zephyria TaxID=28612 RepID=UPI0008116C43|nr:PREDICTED: uncharacterized protein LOC108363745 isoform X1 [Rhagoletis zephyria]